MARKGVLADLIEKKLPAGNSDTDGESGADKQTQTAPPFQGAIGTRGAIGAISRSIAGLTNAASDAERLRTQLTSGHAVVELDPLLLDPSPIADRLNGHDVRELLESIKASGQQVPILVRPHPETQGRYQIAYGHRRVRALAQIGHPVKAVVRQLTDEELVVAQGQENNARRDLSYIERALYASRLEKAGYNRETLMAALAVDKTQLSKLISSVAKIPIDIIEAIGPAPEMGRNRWVALAQKFDTDDQAVFIARSAISSADFGDVETDRRFEIIEKTLQEPRPERPKAESVVSASGRKVGRISRSGRDLKISIDKKFDAAFVEFLVSKLPILADEFSKARKKDT
ncbi:plasmid partitioning protein RepB [Microvirga sp. VF16]|uniref:plasmid partitioning protein RepB n=1 Tax=Microvirga sp. VF16 TaxID=2807101 RepID=UPI00193D421B|nr:plasmid partitioning protein RepB [Microvirga sp. VF16]QRM33934.1 plasmid partitioning protein RepB [Microvirga sp. VF16]